jgi:hypothetical protein
LLQRTPTRKIILIGYSYGSVIASSVTDECQNVIGYAAISYPFSPLKWILLGPLFDKAKSKKPKLFIIGSRDNFTTVNKFKERMKELPEPLEYHIVDEEDHFWVNSEQKITQLLIPWIQTTYQQRATSNLEYSLLLDSTTAATTATTAPPNNNNNNNLEGNGTQNKL